MRRVAHTIVLVLVAGVVLSAHLAVKKTTPAKGARLAAAPDHVQVWFTQEPDLAVSSLRLAGRSGAVKLGPVEHGGDRSLRARVEATLSAGDYTVTWKTAGDDGHVMQGSFTFSVTAPARTP
jgi:methionine-rich copper-binding protein CopC